MTNELITEYAEKLKSKPAEVPKTRYEQLQVCPKCKFRTLDLWKAYGRCYLKCIKCGYEVL